MNEKALLLHERAKGKLEIRSKVPLETREDLSLAYTPGVAAVSLEIAKDKEQAYKYTSKGNMVAVITDGTAVLGLGDIGPEAALPVMEGKCLLFKHFAGIDAVPICLNTKDTEEIIKTIKHIAPTYGGINLEDISFPRCVEIERRLKEELDIPVFHDDQHGTAIVVAAALINAAKLVKKAFPDLKIVMSGLGAAGSSIARLLKHMGVGSIVAYNKEGIVSRDKPLSQDLLNLIDQGIIEDVSIEKDTLESLMVNRDVFIGVSVGGIVHPKMVNQMNDHPIVFALANPTPEIGLELISQTKAYIYATGRSDIYNQINNVLAFPGIFHGAFRAKSQKITQEMVEASARAIANLIQEQELHPEYIIPSVFDKRVMEAVSDAVYQKAKEQKLSRD